MARGTTRLLDLLVSPIRWFGLSRLGLVVLCNGWLQGFGPCRELDFEVAW